MNDRIPNGSPVSVVINPDNISEDWSQEALRTRKPAGVHRGTVVCHHDSHGLCYEVQFPDGSISCYDPHEVSPLNLGDSTP